MKSPHVFQLGAFAIPIASAFTASYAADAPTTTSSRFNSTALQISTTYDRFIITYRDGSTEHSNVSAVLQHVGAAVSRAGIRGGRGIHSALGVTHQRKLANGSDLVHTSSKLTPTEANALLTQIAADPAVAYVEVDAPMYAVRDIEALTNDQGTELRRAPNDPDYATRQWHFNNPIGGANVDKAWNLADGDGVVVAVIDTGITDHPDIDLRLANAGYDFISDARRSGRATDARVSGGWDTGDWTTDSTYADCRRSGDSGQASSWHGTHVAGTIAELTYNGVGMAGVAHNAKVLPIRVLGHCGGYTSDIADAVVWASGGHVEGVPDNAHPAQVINMSLGGQGSCSANSIMGKAISYAISRGTTVVVAAGNSNADTANFSPANCPGAIAVASNGITGKRAFYSNYGASITLAAPGGGVYQGDGSSGVIAGTQGFVWSAVNKGTTVPGTAGYGGMAGTSQAAPHVAGAVAMVLSATRDAGLPTPTPAQISTLLTSTSRPFPVALDQPIGTGILDAYAAVDKAIRASSPAEQAVPLTNGVLLGKQSGGAGASALYSITLPAGARNLSLRTFAGSGDVSIYVSANHPPAANGLNAQYKSVRPGNNETVMISKPIATTYYLRMVGVSAYADVYVLANYTF
ncbi:S8 family peptidase [Dyella sp. 20L07]|uniref:S8 family peptidase n=1 Tax=Dyella sp. 20L07 TaxID=3384240 RepID=UPI003D273F4D